ncbi:MAG: YfhO family protein [Planctomycetota bacterium]|nr:YfhO family protein [Planctomycetota bacterium]MDA1212716.1 YfhO family protein [Planctomycetota bacterium]
MKWLAADNEEMNVDGRSWQWHLLAAIVLAFVALVVFHPLTLHPTEVLVGPQREGLNDLIAYYIPSREYATAMQQKYGEFPAWNPHISLGLAYVGNPQSALYYPPNWLCHFLPASIALSWLLVAHHWWAGFGVYFLLRSMRCRWGSALFAGIVALSAPYWLAHTGDGHYAQICAVSWIPWGMLAYQSVRVGDRLGVIAMGFVLAMSFFCNHVQETYYLVLILSLFVVADMVALMAGKDMRSALQLMVRWFTVGIMTIGVVCIDLIPIQLYSNSSMRAVFRESGRQISGDQFLMQNFAQLLDPFIIGTPTVYKVEFTPYCEMALYFGLIPCVLAGMGIAGCYRRPGVVRLSLVLAGSFLFAMGRNGPLFPLLYDTVPGIAWFRGPGRALFFTQIVIAMLAGFGVDFGMRRLSAKSSEKETTFAWFPLLIACAFGLLASVVIGLTMPKGLELTSTEILRQIWQSPIIWLCLAAPATTFFAVDKLVSPANARWRNLAIPILLGIVTLIESGRFSSEAITTVRPIAIADRSDNIDDERIKSETADDELNRAFDLRQLAAANGDAGSYPRVATQHFILNDQRSSEMGIHRLRGYDPLMLTYYFVAIQNLTLEKTPPIEEMGFWKFDLTKTRLNLIDLFGVKYALWSKEYALTPPAGWIVRGAGRVPPIALRREDSIAEKSIPVECWENPNALPRAFIVGNVEKPKSQADLKQQLDSFDPRRAVLLDNDVLPQGPRSEFRPATITDYSPNHIKLTAKLDQPGYLVLTDLFQLGWKATDNGRPTRIMLGDLAFRVIPLEPGTHEIAFDYTPPGYLQGKIITLMTLFTTLIVAINRLRKNGPADSSSDGKVREPIVQHHDAEITDPAIGEPLERV